MDLTIGLSQTDPEKAFFSCNPGYNLVGPTTITCKNSNWEGKEPTCQRELFHNSNEYSNEREGSVYFPVLARQAKNQLKKHALQNCIMISCSMF